MRRQSAIVDKALRMVARGDGTAYAIAKKLGIALSTIYRAQRRAREDEDQRRRRA
jgi:transposase